ncbi:hypothetical protein HMPREF1624_04406 [Sporothrix schenckii ATCC 58251]|uniref:protein O-GlcNAc transferase n=1 Tax=Sporothrix schenckii (strain ATCC 58251 / de Perez 2211183) TaxID=1391915 RepID=U7PUA2_SPOS1|nr:hypothetical protein HMPREF1624_04406 [Sporothrix schenckii ATCC 58251]
MEQPVIQMHQQPVPSRRRFEPLMPFHAHLRPGQFAALQQQLDLQQQHQHQHHPQTHQQHPFPTHNQYLSQSRAVRPQQGQQAGPSGPAQTFPIRSSHPASPSTNAQPGQLLNAQLHGQNRHPFASSLTVNHGPEHHLRRKTPNGTIDAGYDGSPVGLATGPPPSKQLALPATPAIFPTPFVQQSGSAPDVQSQQGFSRTPAAAAAFLGQTGEIQQLSAPVAGRQFLVGNNATPLATAVATAASANFDNAMVNQAAQIQPGLSFAQQLPNNGGFNPINNPTMQPVFAPAYQPTPGPTSFNTSSFDRQSLWPDSVLLQGYQPHLQQLLQQQQLQAHMFPFANMSNLNTGAGSLNGNIATNNNGLVGNYGFVPQNIACDSAFISAAQPMFSPPGLNNDGMQQTAMPGQQAAFQLSSSVPQRHSGMNMHPLSMHGQEHISLENLDTRQPGVLPHLMHAVGLTPGSAPPMGADMPAHIKDATLKFAEATYANLVLHLSQTKKSFNGRPLPNLHARPKPAAVSRLEQLKQLQLKHRQAQQVESQGLASDNAGQDQFAAARAAMGGNQMQNFRSPMRTPYGDPNAKNRRDAFDMHTPLVLQARDVLTLLSTICEGSGWKWVEGMNLGACLHYALEHFEQAFEWFKRVFALQPTHVEVLSNIAATLFCMGRRDEAIKFWLRAIHSKPSYFDSSEHLIGILSTEHRHREIVEIVNYVQNTLRLPNHSAATPADNSSTGGGTAKRADLENDVAPDAAPSAARPGDSSETASEDIPMVSKDTSSPDTSQAGFGSCGYAIPGHDTGRMLGLLHAKANSLYLMKEMVAASEAYEECVLVGVGRHFRSIQNLIQRIRTALSPEAPQSSPRSYFSRPSSGPPLLAPEVAKLTARRTFPYTNGQLPGLRYVLGYQHKKAALTATSNALLSMAKILQDGMASNGCLAQGSNGQSTAVGDILSLYYLSMSIQESPSTANNVGILLASIQQTTAAKPAHVQKQIKQIQNVPQQPQQQQQQQQVQIARRHSHQPTAASTTPTTPNAVPSGIPPDSSLALAFTYYSYGLQLDPKHVHLHTNLGSLLKDVGQLDLAIKMYEQAVACDGKFDIALTNLANAVKDRGRSGEAIAYYRRAVAANPEFTEAVCGLSTALNSVCDWAGRGGVVLYGGRYDRWHVDDEGMLQDVRQYGRGSGLMKRVVDIVARQLNEASLWGRGVLHESSVAMLACQMKEAMGTADRNTTVKGDAVDVTAELQKWAGQPWEGSRVLRLIERATRVVMYRWYCDRYIRGKESPNGYSRPRPPASLAVPGAPTVLPFHTFTCPLPAKEVRLISQRNALRISCNTLRSPWLSGTVYPPPAPPRPQLNVGYISSDFNNHPLAHLMQSVFGFHNPTRAKAFCYATTPSDKSPYREKIERDSPVFRDVTNWPPERVIQQIIQDGIHILVNLNGYTRGAKNEIFAARPAPIQMAFMGFAGTLGAEWCDYLLADTTAVPPSTLRPWRGNVSVGDVFRDEADVDTEKWIYAENIIYCRDTFFCCDHKQFADASERTVTWQDEKQRRWKMRKEMFPSLSDDAIILGNFNQLYKIDPTTFRSWLRILAGVPNAVLWLLRFPDLGEPNIRKTALKWAGKSVADRIIFTDVAPKALHINRARICDVFLDTPECNAHTTAADALWSSTPLLTSPRYDYKMCSRIGASVLKGALPKDAAGQQAAAELIAEDDDQYEKMAIKLASGMAYRQVACANGVGTYGEGEGRLADLRKMLWDHKWECGLFDTRRWVRDLEDAYTEAWRKWANGERGDIYL